MGLRQRCRRLSKDFPKFLIIGFVVFNLCLLTWDSIPCSPEDVTERDERGVQSFTHHAHPHTAQHTGIEKMSLKTRNKVKQEDKPNSHKLEYSYKLTESDLLLQRTSSLNVKKYQRILREKTEDLKSKGLLRKIEPHEPCNWKIPGGPCVDRTCKTSMPDPLSEESILSVMKPLTRIKHFSLDKFAEKLGPIPRGSKVTFLTASSSNHFLESQALIENLHRVVFPHVTNFTFYFYDIGLKEHERQQLKKHCRCIIKKYPLDILPERFSFLRGFTWKPLIINAHLPHTEYVVWTDASIRFRTTNLGPMFQEARDRGLIISPGGKFSIGEHTALPMFEYYNTKPCQLQHYQQAEASFQILHNQPFTRELFIKAWAGCAMDPQCMCPHSNVKVFHCPAHIRKYGKCDRTDQAAHSLILSKLFQKNSASFFVPKGRYHVIRRHEDMHYFAMLEKKGH